MIVDCMVVVARCSETFLWRKRYSTSGMGVCSCLFRNCVGLYRYFSFCVSIWIQYPHARLRLDDALQHADPTPAYDMFNVYVQRVHERVAFAREQLKEPKDFTIDENYLWDRSDVKWAKNEEELNELGG